MEKVLGESYFIDLDAVEKYLQLEDVISTDPATSGETETKVNLIKFELVKMFLDDNNNLIWADKKKRKLCYFNNRECKSPLEKAPKNVRKVGVDMITLEVFDVDGVGLIKLGVVDKNGKLV